METAVWSPGWLLFKTGWTVPLKGVHICVCCVCIYTHIQVYIICVYAHILHIPSCFRKKAQLSFHSATWRTEDDKRGRENVFYWSSQAANHRAGATGSGSSGRKQDLTTRCRVFPHSQVSVSSLYFFYWHFDATAASCFQTCCNKVFHTVKTQRNKQKEKKNFFCQNITRA